MGAPADTPEGGKAARTPKNTSGLSKIALREEQYEEDETGGAMWTQMGAVVSQAEAIQRLMREFMANLKRE